MYFKLRPVESSLSKVLLILKSAIVPPRSSVVHNKYYQSLSTESCLSRPSLKEHKLFVIFVLVLSILLFMLWRANALYFDATFS